MNNANNTNAARTAQARYSAENPQSSIEFASTVAILDAAAKTLCRYLTDYSMLSEAQAEQMLVSKRGETSASASETIDHAIELGLITSRKYMLALA